MVAKKITVKVFKENCVACGVCEKNCPFAAINIVKGHIAVVDKTKCKGCAKCEKVCPAGIIEMRSEA